MNRMLGLFTLASLLSVGLLHAHELTIDWEIRSGGLVIRATSDGTAAAGAKVEVQSSEGRPLATGILDQNGTWTWPLSAVGQVTLVVDAGLGHRQTLTLTEAQLRASSSQAPQTGLEPHPTVGEALHDDPALHLHEERLSLKWRVLLGLSLLMATAAGWMSFSNLRRVTQLESRLRNHESGG